VIDALFQVVSRLDSDRDFTASMSRQFDFLDESPALVARDGTSPGEFRGRVREHLSGAHSTCGEAGRRDRLPGAPESECSRAGRGMLQGAANVHLIEPLEYLPFTYLMKRSHLVLTDSGGIQEEAPSLGKPVLVMRDNTERPEAVTAGTVRLVAPC